MNTHPLLRKPDIEGLLKWGKANGCVIPDCITFKHEFSIGIHGVVNTPIKDNKPEVKIHLPNDLIIDGRLTEEVFGERGTKWSKMLLARLRFEKDSTNPKIVELQKKFKLYVDSLPPVIDSPMVWNPEEFDLLKGTNLGSSIFKKFAYLYKEWGTFGEKDNGQYIAMGLDPFGSGEASTLKMPADLYGQDSTNDIHIQWGPIEDALVEYLQQNTIYANIYKQFTKLIYRPDEIEWDSFIAYFWAHLTYTSRAFPERIINPNCDESDVMLLPIVDLLNHGNRTKVEWSTDKDGSFCYTNLEKDIPEGNEIFNNYGAKSNEELLYGYGFTIKDNEFDTVLLVLKLDDQMFRQAIYKKTPFKIPILEDYTSYAFESKKTEYDSITDSNGWRPIDKYSDGMAYVINKINTLECVNQLLDIFSFISKRDDDADYLSVLSRLKGIQQLKIALNEKLVKIEAPWEFETKMELDEFYPILEKRRIHAENYKNGQIEILKKSLKLLKGIEKVLLAENKSNILTAEKIRKHDKDHDYIMKRLIDHDESKDIIDRFNDRQIMITWLTARIHFNSFPNRYRWVLTQFEEFKKTYHPTDISEDTVDLYALLFKGADDSSSSLKMGDDSKIPVTIQELSIVSDFLHYNSFMRVSLTTYGMTAMLIKEE
ncbi:hypothetical protein C6P45_003322 [Maudiozyma exigua]|uniref:SET domain-containing protein n=1 Tax=Maudiozyma exigua TaxID=34358 RepID=A0A9P7BCI6_MAUEX|nr:hypothetical protein C6P45_003322 [Kazachstania exigua]